MAASTPSDSQSTDSAGQAKQKWTGKSRGGALGTRIFVELIHYCGLRAAYTLLLFVAPYYVFFAPRSTRAIWFFNRRALGKSRLASVLEIFRTYYAFGQCIIDKMAVGQGLQDNFDFTSEGSADVMKLLGNPSGTILLSAHVGAWEVGAPFFGNLGIPFNVTIYQAEHEGVKRAIESEALDRPYRFINIAGDGIESVMNVKNALDRGEVVCFMGDRFMDGSPTAVHSFLGLQARFPLGPFQVAAALSVPVAYYFAIREKGSGGRPRYRFVLGTLTPTSAPRRKAVAQMLDEYVQILEGIVRQYPRQWFNLYSYFIE